MCTVAELKEYLSTIDPDTKVSCIIWNEDELEHTFSEVDITECFVCHFDAKLHIR